MKRMLRRTFALCLLIVVACSVTAFADDFSIITPISPNTIDFDDSNKQDWTQHWNIGGVTGAEVQSGIAGADGNCLYTGTPNNATWGCRLFVPGNNGKTGVKNPIYGVAEISFDLKYTYDSTLATLGDNTKTHVLKLKNSDSGKDLLGITLCAYSNVYRFRLTDKDKNESVNPGALRGKYTRWFTYNIKVNVAKGTYVLTITDKEEPSNKETFEGYFTEQDVKNIYCLSIIPQNANTNNACKVYIDNYNVKRETYVVGTPTIQFEDGIATATVKAQSESTENVTSPQLIVALYDDNDILLNVNYATKAITGRGSGSVSTINGEDVECSVTTPAGKMASYAKAFVWNSIDGLKPYITPVEVSLAQ